MDSHGTTINLQSNQQAIEPPPSTRTKFKTVTKKIKNRNCKPSINPLAIEHLSMTPIITLKRKTLDEYDNRNNNSNHGPKRKKRKVNKSINNKAKALFDSNKLLKKEKNELIKQRDHYKSGCNMYKKEANKWKSKYIKLHSQIYGRHNNDCNNTNDNTSLNDSMSIMDTECEIEIEINKNELSLSPPPPPSKYFHKPNNKITRKTSRKKKSKTSSKKNKNNMKRKNNTHSMDKSKYEHPLQPFPEPSVDDDEMNDNINTINQNINMIRKNNTNESRNIISQSDIRSNNNSDEMKVNNTTKYDSIRDRLLQMGYDKNEIINRISLYNQTNETPQFVFNKLIHTFANNSSNKLKFRSHTKHNKYSNGNSLNNINDNILSTDNMSEYVEFENSYYVSVHCHICKKHFIDIYKYRDHLKQHYMNDTNREWKQCDFGCELKPQYDMHFISHISQHTNDMPYKCNVSINGIQCKISMGYKPDIKQHWKSHFKSILNKQNHSRFQKIENNSKYVEFENSYHISVHCYICKKHFDEMNKYKTHLEKHYKNDPNRQWLKCDLGCEKIDPNYPLFADNMSFISHISQHTNDKPFKCDVIINGNIKCQSMCDRKETLKSHWKTHFKKIKHNHKKYIYNKRKTTKSKKISKNKTKQKIKRVPFNSTSNSHKKENKIIKTEIHSDFENSYYVSVQCHVCCEHFNDINEYKTHIKDHYINDNNRQWLTCDFGCKDNKSSTSVAFLCHIASHTKVYPFKCSIVSNNGNKCAVATGTKPNLRKHWESKHNKKRYKYKYNDTYDSSSESSDESSTSYSYSSSYSSSSSSSFESEIESDSESETVNDNIDCDYIEFEQNHMFSMCCHICMDKQNFEDMNEYRDHIKQHYDKNENRNWLECDFGCVKDEQPNMSLNTGNFICHIASHTNQKPFQCAKCTYASTTKGVLKKHWKSSHFKAKTNDKKEPKDEKINGVKS